jgi:hypothetical protein
MAEGEFVDDGLSAFGDEGDITRELTRCLLDGHAVPGLEETFAALRALRPPAPDPLPHAIAARLPHESFPDVAPPVPAAGAPRDVDVGHALEHLERLRAQKKAAEAHRQRRSLTRTLAGNPGQLRLFG